MQILINNMPAVLKSGSSFEYVSENRMFTDADDYTLEITLPLAGCRQNIEIFGKIFRKDVDPEKLIFDCELRDRNFYKFGSVTITQVTEKEVKVQFLEGRSEQNYDTTFDKIYINELELGEPPTTDISRITPMEAWDPISNKNVCVALPWVNDNTGDIQNLAEYVEVDKAQNKYHFEWSKDCDGLSWQPYLIYIAKKICDEIGYSYDFSKWESSEYRYLLICNTLPFAWDMPGFANALPQWTVEEFFRKLELLLNGEFTFDHRKQRITFDFTFDEIKKREAVKIDEVLDEHTVDITLEDDKCEYKEAVNLAYKDCDYNMWKFYSCDWFIDKYRSSAKSFDNMTEFLSHVYSCREWNGMGNRGQDAIRGSLYYVKDVDAYFLIRSLSKELVFNMNEPPHYKYKMEIRSVNMFGSRYADDSEKAKTTEIEFVPVSIDETEDKYGKCMFLSFSEFDNSTEDDWDWSLIPDGDREAYEKQRAQYLFQPRACGLLLSGEKEQKAEFYDYINIGWWDGTLDTLNFEKLPHPYVEDLEIASDWKSFRINRFSLRINSHISKRGKIAFELDTKTKKSFKFLSDQIPDVRSVFNIRGKKYLCEKLTCTFTEVGRSELIKGEFWPILKQNPV